MDFTLSKEQRDIQKAAREFALGEFLPERAQEFDRTETFDLDFPEHFGQVRGPKSWA